MKLTRSTRLGTALALAVAFGAPLLVAAAPAKAEPMRMNAVETDFHRGRVEPVRYEHRGMRFDHIRYRHDMRFHRHDFDRHGRAWFWRHHEHRDFDR